jgi:hypothetical protein
MGALLVASPRSHPDPVAVRSRARQVLKASSCDKCHDSSVSKDHAKALSIYDLDRAEWPDTMTGAQLPRLLSRLKGAAAADVQVVRAFIRSELESRAQRR